MNMGFLYVFLAIFIVCFELLRKKKKQFDYLTLFNIYFVAYYCFPPICMNLLQGYTNRYNISYRSFYAFFLIMLSYLVVILAYKVRFVIKKGVITSKSNYRIYRYIKNERIFIQNMVRVLFFIGFISFCGYSMIYGGFANTLMNAALIRDGLVESSGDFTSIEFIKRFIICLEYMALFVIVMWQKKNVSIWILILSILCAGVYLIIHAGRAAILTFALIVIFILNSNTQGSNTKKKIGILKWALMFGIVGIGIIYLRPLLVSLSSLSEGFDAFINAFQRRINTNTNVIDFKSFLFNVAYYLEHKYISVETAIYAISNRCYSFNFFIDIISAAVSIIPSVLLPFNKPSSIGTVNTKLVLGYEGSSMPPGGVAFGYYALGILGVVLFAFVIGVVGRKMEQYFDSYKSEYINSVKYTAMFVWVDLFINGELREWFLRYFVFLCIVVVIHLKSKRSVGIIDDNVKNCN